MWSTEHCSYSSLIHFLLTFVGVLFRNRTVLGRHCGTTSPILCWVFEQTVYSCVVQVHGMDSCGSSFTSGHFFSLQMWLFPLWPYMVTLCLHGRILGENGPLRKVLLSLFFPALTVQRGAFCGQLSMTSISSKVWLPTASAPGLKQRESSCKFPHQLGKKSVICL